MIILDTNVISDLMSDQPDHAVVHWLNRQPRNALWMSSITVYEILTGLATMPPGRRQARMRDAFDAAFTMDFESRALEFDVAAVRAAASITARRQREGHRVDLHDTQIAGIATARRATIATRNLRHFDDLDVPVVNPWER